ncbi:dCTP deaminase [Streptomyces griseoincarnatus]
MILTGSEIARQRELGGIHIEPFAPEHVQPNSYDFHLGNRVLVYRDRVLDARRPNPTEEILIPEDGLELTPDRVYLGSSLETMGSDRFAPRFDAKSGVARSGLFIHITAGLVDIGSLGQYTLMLHAVQPLRIYPGMLIGQITFWRPEGRISLYDGKYQGAEGPQASRIHEDFGEPGSRVEEDPHRVSSVAAPR